MIAIILFICSVILIYYFYIKTKKTDTSITVSPSNTVTVLPYDITVSPTTITYTPFNIIPGSIDNGYILAWYDPNNIVINSNNEVISWTNSKNINSFLLNNVSGSFVQTNGLINQVEPGLFLPNTTKMIKFPPGSSAIYTNELTSEMNAFVCVLFALPPLVYDAQMLFSPLGPDVDFSFRRVNIQISTFIGNFGDLTTGTGGLVRVNAVTCLENNAIFKTYNNMNKYVVLSVRFGNDKNANGGRYDWNTPIKICLGNLIFSDRFFNGYLGDFVCLKKTHTLRDMMDVENYLMNKWNINNTIGITASPSVYNIIDNTYIVAWYDPRNVVLNNNNEIISWNNSKNNNTVLSLNKVVSGPLKQVDHPNISELKGIDFTKLSAIYSTDMQNDINAFVCTLYPIANGNEDLHMLYSPFGPYTDFSFRRAVQLPSTYVGNHGDLTTGTGGLIRVNTETCLQDDVVIKTYNNLNKYIVLSVRFGNDKNINNGRYDWNTPANVCIGNVAFGDLRAFKGYIGDFVCLNKFHTLQDMMDVENYLMNKWNISKPVVTTNPPYYTTSPPYFTTSPPRTTNPPYYTTSPPRTFPPYNFSSLSEIYSFLFPITISFTDAQIRKYASTAHGVYINTKLNSLNTDQISQLSDLIMNENYNINLKDRIIFGLIRKKTILTYTHPLFIKYGIPGQGGAQGDYQYWYSSFVKLINNITYDEKKQVMIDLLNLIRQDSNQLAMIDCKNYILYFFDIIFDTYFNTFTPVPDNVLSLQTLL